MMTYYRVLQSADHHLVKQNNHGGQFRLVANELFTSLEVNKNNIPLWSIEKVEVSQKKTHFFFGARFEDCNSWDRILSFHRDEITSGEMDWFRSFFFLGKGRRKISARGRSRGRFLFTTFTLSYLFPSMRHKYFSVHHCFSTFFFVNHTTKEIIFKNFIIVYALFSFLVFSSLPVKCKIYHLLIP